MTNFNGLKTWLKEHKITEVECIVSDLTGIARGKIMPASKFCDDAGIRLPEGVLVATVTGDYLDDYSMIDPAEIDVYLKQILMQHTYCLGPQSQQPKSFMIVMIFTVSWLIWRPERYCVRCLSYMQTWALRPLWPQRLNFTLPKRA